MELYPVFYEENPFEHDPNFRVEGASVLDTKELYQLFVKNLVAFVFYETKLDAVDYEDSFAFEKQPKNQQEIYKMYLSGTLRARVEGPIALSPLIDFCKYENRISEDSASLDWLTYLNFISEHLTVLHRIDTLVNLSTDSNSGLNFMQYLGAHNLIYPYLNLTQIGDELDAFFVAACKGLGCSYIFHFDESSLFPEDFEVNLQRIGLVMKLDLLDDEDRKEIIKYSYNWLTHRFKDFGIRQKIYFPVFENDGPFIFQPMLDEFARYFSPVSQPVVKKSFPTHIFSSYEGYHLFDTLANGLYMKVTVSYVYRLLFEKGLIVVKDTPFREWYNAQEYPIVLETATETLQKSTSSDREQFVEIVAGLLGVSL